MKICAILLNYFGHEETKACVRSLVDQEIDKVFILDNSGNDDEKQALLSSLSSIPKAEVDFSPKNLGFAGGVNFVLRKQMPAEFDAFLILNNDTIASPDLIKNLTLSANDATLDIASPVIYNYPEKDILWSRGNHYNVWTGLITHRPVPFLPGSFYYLTGCCLLIHRRVFESIGFLDESFFMYGEDVEFCHRAVSKGFHPGTVPSAVIYHKTSSSSRHNSVFYEQHINRTHFLLSGKLINTRRAQMIASILKIVFLGTRAFVRTIRYCNLNAMRGYIIAMRKTFFEGKTPLT